MYNSNYVNSKLRELFKSDDFRFGSNYLKGCIINEVLNMPLYAYAGLHLYKISNLIKYDDAFWVSMDNEGNHRLYLPQVLSVNEDFTVGTACNLLMDRRNSYMKIYKGATNYDFLTTDPISRALFDLLIRPGISVWCSLHNSDFIARPDVPYSSIDMTDEKIEHIMYECNKLYLPEPDYYHPIDLRNATSLDKRIMEQKHKNVNYDNLNKKIDYLYIAALFYANVEDLYIGSCIETTHYNSESEKFTYTKDFSMNLIDTSYLNSVTRSLRPFSLQLSDRNNPTSQNYDPLYCSWFIGVFDSTLEYKKGQSYRCPTYLSADLADEFFNRIIINLDAVYRFYKNNF